MRLAYFDPFSGAAGDMVVGALLDAGAPLDGVREAILSTGLDGVVLRAERDDRQGIAATRFIVEVSEHGHGHEAGHGGHAQHAHRCLADILAMLQGAKLAERARVRATAVFRALAEAEGRVHGKSAEAVCFHEVGAADSIADVVGAAAALELLGVDEVLSAPPALGHDGFIECAHGRLPIPAPAVVELLRGRPVKPGSPGVEQTTPTGAAILAALSSSFGPPPEMTLGAVGHGAGSRSGGEGGPNVLRVILGERAGATEPSGGGELVEISATVDDLSGQVLGYLFERLPVAGAIEVSLLPATLKKSRPGARLVVLAPAARLDDVAAAIFRETTTLGLRYTPVSRLTLERQSVEVSTRWGSVRVKCGLLSGRVVTASPEFEDCRRLALEAGVPLKDVQAEASRLFARSRPE